MNPPGGTYSSDQSITITSTTADAVIHYTTDGSDPVESSTVYSAPIAVAGDGTSMTIKAIATKTSMSNSEIKTGIYNINYSQVSTPLMNPAGSTYNSDQSVEITCGTSGAVIHYTTDGSDPDGSSPGYSAPIAIVGHGTNMTIKAFATKAGMLDSTIRTETYSIQYPTITSITSSTADGAYGSGAGIDITVTFSEPVTLSGGTLDITLDTGKVVSITAFTSAGSASCVYSVGSNESSNDLDSTAITLNGGTLRNSGNADVIINLPSTTINDGSNIVADGYLPAITGFSLTSGSPTTDHFITFTLDGSDSGTGVTCWLVNESATKPSSGDPGWAASKPAAYTLSQGYGIKTVYAWAKDGASNISEATGNSTFNVEVQYIGVTPWTFEKNNAGDDMPKGAAIDYNDNIYAIGLKVNATNDWQIIKIAPDGTEDTTNWNKAFDWYGGSDSAQAVATDSANNVYVIGWFTNGTDINWGIKKYTTGGTEVRSTEWNYTSDEDEAQAIAIDSNDNVYVAGYITKPAGDCDWWMKKYHPDGSEDTTNWNFGFDGGYGDDTAIAAAVDSADNVYIAGRVMNSSGNIDWMVKKYNANGFCLWSRQFDQAGKTDRAYTLAVDSNNNLYVAGMVTRADNNIDWCIKKYDSSGNEDTTNWNKIIDNGTDDVAWGINTDSADNVYVGGRLLYADNEWAIIKFDSNGTEITREEITNSGNDWCRSVVMDSMDYMYGIGGIYRSGTGSDWYIEKYVP